MGQSFKLQLEKLTDEEFMQLLVNRDTFTTKKLRMIDQEARNRYFSNKDFNGEKDVYFNPEVKINDPGKGSDWVKISALAGGVVFLVLMFFIISNLVKNDSVPTQVIEKQELAHIDYPKVTDGEENKIPEKEIISEPVQNQSSKDIQPAKNEDISKATSVEKIAGADQSLSGNADRKENQENIQPVSGKTSEPQTGQNSQKQVVENKNIQNQGVMTSESTKKTQTHELKQPTDTGKKSVTVETAEKQKVTKPEEVTKDGDDKPRMYKITDLSTEQLRQLVKFQNEWAFRQTNAKSVIDYYVDGNAAIKFILNQTYSDSVSNYQQRFVPNLTRKYWTEFEKELGNQFPKTSIQIQFVRFDAKF